MASVNDMIIYQAGPLLADLVEQATGQKIMAPANTGEFISAATTAIKNGYEPILNAMSQMWGNTIFSTRPYTSKMRGLEMDMERWGNATRKLSVVSNAPQNDQRFLWPVGYDATQSPANGNGNSVDMFKLAKKDILQTVFYGQSVYEDVFTIFRDNLDTAFRGPEEFMAFNSLQMEDRSNSLETWKDTLKHGLISNLGAALYQENNATRVVHLVTEYATEYGDSTMTLDQIRANGQFADLMRWIYAKMNTVAREMSMRTVKYQTTIAGKPILRHTPAKYLRCYVSGRYWDQIQAMVLSNTWHDDYLRTVDMEDVAYWQNIDSPTAISCKPVMTEAATGNAVVSATDVSVNNVFALMFDRDALGFATVNEWSAMSPFNITGGYWNDAYHANVRARQDMTEKAVLFLLD